ncbi:MAG TPA: DUF6519 domain-containing protein [Candidatus Limnocylindrales bacterium]|nr:DUF6519 domain-containing protein [Candidatus Limnocylindrales bacterium]
MKGDFSQLDPRRDARYDAVLHQQGRLWLDSDWNAEVFERLDRLARETIDVVGVSGFAYPGDAFKIGAPAGGDQSDFIITGAAGSAGRAYAGGMLCERGETISYLTQPDLPDAPPIVMPDAGSTLRAVVYLEAWRRLITYLQDPSVREVALGGPDTATRLKTIAQVRVAPVGTNAVDCGGTAAYLPQPSAGTMSTHVVPPAPPPDRCSLPNPEGYTGQANRLYRVEIHAAGDVAGASGSSAFRTQLSAAADTGATTLAVAPALTPAQQAALTAAKTAALVDAGGRYAALAVASVSSDGLQITLSSALAEAFAKGSTVASGAAEFKWSRNNASDAVAITPSLADPTLVTLSSLGRDADTALRAGDLVEIGDDATDLGPGAGFLTYLAADPDPDTLVARLADPLPADLQKATPAMHPVLRRWDGRGFAATAFDPVLTPDMSLQDGIFVTFGGTNGASNLRASDYWTFIARSIDGSVETLTGAPPQGIVRSYVPLAIVTWANANGTITFNLENDCRTVFSPLSEVPGRAPSIHVTGVDGVDSGGNAAAAENDKSSTPTAIAGGLRFLLDGAANPTGVSPATCFATTATAVAPLNLPVQANLGGTWAADAETKPEKKPAIRWMIAPTVAESLLRLRQLAAAGNVPLRFRLHGDCIWSAGDPNRYLDGDAFGYARGDGSIALRFPSGDEIRGGDFETWFTLVPDVQQQLGVYVSDTSSTSGPAIAVFPAIGAGAPSRKITDTANINKTMRGVAVGGTFLYVVNAPNVQVYPANANGAVTPVKTLTGLGAPWGAVADGSANVYVADTGFGATPQPGVAFFMTGSTTATLLADGNLSNPRSVALDAQGNVYATNWIEKGPGNKPGVVIFPPSGSAMYILGDKTNLSNPFGVAVGPDGAVYVTNTGTDNDPAAVRVFKAGQFGDVAPTRTITGAATQLVAKQTWSCAVDATGYLYAVSGLNVLVFAPGADGNAAPLIVIPASAGPPPSVLYIALGAS